MQFRALFYSEDRFRAFRRSK